MRAQMQRVKGKVLRNDNYEIHCIRSLAIGNNRWQSEGNYFPTKKRAGRPGWRFGVMTRRTKGGTYRGLGGGSSGGISGRLESAAGDLAGGGLAANVAEGQLGGLASGGASEGGRGADRSDAQGASGDGGGINILLPLHHVHRDDGCGLVETASGRRTAGSKCGGLRAEMMFEPGEAPEARSGNRRSNKGRQRNHDTLDRGNRRYAPQRTSALCPCSDNRHLGGVQLWRGRLVRQERVCGGSHV